MAFAGGLPDCEAPAVAWPDSAQLTVGTWPAPGGDPAAEAGPACAAAAVMISEQSESPARMAPRRLARPRLIRLRLTRLGRPPMSDAAVAALAAACFLPMMGLTSDRPFA
jgi:hypothetical protein